MRSWNDEHVARARAPFTSFGTCNIIDPVDDVVRLGLLSLPERTAAFVWWRQSERRGAGRS